jgi:hypothetical protein
MEHRNATCSIGYSVYSILSICRIYFVAHNKVSLSIYSNPCPTYMVVKTTFKVLYQVHEDTITTWPSEYH